MAMIYVLLLLSGQMLSASEENKPLISIHEKFEKQDEKKEAPSIVVVSPDKNTIAGSCVCEMDIPCPKKDQGCCTIQ